MKKTKLFLDHGKMEKWLNEMVNQGQAFTNFNFSIYTFQPCVPGEYIYRIQCVSNQGCEKDEYMEFLEEMNIEVMCVQPGDSVYMLFFLCLTSSYIITVAAQATLKEEADEVSAIGIVTVSSAIS